MRVFFRNDELGIAPEKFARLLALFEDYSHRLNAAASPRLIREALRSLPEGQAPDYLQVVGADGLEGDGLTQLQKIFTNFFPCYVGENPPVGYLITSATEAGSLPNFDTFLDLHRGERSSAKEIFQKLKARQEAGEEFSGLRLRHSVMTEEDFSVLEELLHNLHKRSIPTSFFSDFVPGFERFSDQDSGHV